MVTMVMNQYLELESSGHRNEVRLHYRSGSHHPHTEVFPYILADDKWHKLSLAISASHLILYIDCNKIYERVVDKPSTDLPLGTTFWLGQRNNAHGYFKGIMQDVQLLVMPQGFIAQCPDLNRTCPTCNDFHGLVQKIMELQDILAKTSAKLSRAEQKMNRLDQCYCERTCTMKGTTYREFESWTDGCKNCTCLNGTIQCETLICPNPDCPLKSALAYVDGKCCKECKSICQFQGRTYFEGERNTVYSSSGVCVLYECKDQTMKLVESSGCPALDCPESHQITLSHSCCKVCKGYDFCSERNNCMDNSVCRNLNDRAVCSCRDGFRALREDNAYCEDIDECGTGRHSCANDTICFNLDGGYDCRCPHGKNCTGDCIHDGKIKHNGQIWVLENDRCSVCSCQQGEVDCWPLPCPEVECEFSVLPENECCPRCVTDPCQADTIRNDITKTCLDEMNVVRFTGSSWIKHGTECTLCQCKISADSQKLPFDAGFLFSY
ncbi:Protein kinase C-binding protein NELL2 [Pteropus alecto]|uniref:Protein kinase C-binding protein NELL2 n=1 Tax=Pteropus alecto TaxID=9402 RepID=L5KDA1_PTEAL|nr:Protein kinase C-binding protein NELL2 [Pteropus alecto]